MFTLHGGNPSAVSGVETFLGQTVSDSMRVCVMMRWGVVTVVMFMPGLGSVAQASDWFTGAAGSERVVAAKPTVAIDLAATATTDGERNGTAIGTIAPFGNLEESGMRFRAGASVGGYTYTSTTPTRRDIEGSQQAGNVMAGYEHVGNAMKIAGFAGIEVRNTELTPIDRNNKSRGAMGGLRVALDFYMQPTDWSMLSANFTFSTINTSYYGRIKGGIAIAQGLYVGPEFLMIGDDTSGQYRLGVHMTGLKVGALQFGVSGGYVSQKERPHAFYGILDARITF
jgi:hypothetical protein